MRVACARCGHRLWSQVRASGCFRMLAHFDDDEESPTYAAHAPRCPGCGLPLDRGISDEEAPFRRIGR